MRQFILEKTVPIRLMMLDSDINRVEVKNYELTFSLATDAGQHNDVYAAQLDQNISFSKITYFLQNVVDESFVYCKDNGGDARTYLATSFSNNLMVLPDLNESILATILHTKLNSIACEYSSVDRVVLKDVQLQLSYDYICTDLEEVGNLPNIQEWMGSMSYWPSPWWSRNDPCTYDNFAKDQKEFDIWKRAQADGLDLNGHTEAFDAIESDLRSLFKKHAGEAPAEVIEVNFADKKPVRKKWVPQVVD